MLRKPILQGLLLLVWLLGALSAQAGVVTNLNDNGPGSLRQAIADASAGDTITFSLSGTLTLTSGGLVIDKNLTITGPGANLLTIQRDPKSATQFGVFINMNSGVTATIQDVTISHGVTSNTDNGGGISLYRSTLTLNNCILSNNSGDDQNNYVAAGGIMNVGGTITLNNCTLSNNSGDRGGGICNLSGGTITLNNCTLSNNFASQGGGILNDIGTLTLNNCTLSNNSTTTGGGGLLNFDMVILWNCTLSGNSADDGDGGGFFNDGIFDCKNCIIANSPSGGNYAGPGQLLVSSVNFSDDATVPGFTQVTSSQLNLGLLGDYGGPTQTIPLLFPSVAIDATSDGTDWSGHPVPTDQRGVSRPQRSQFDVGAFEYQNQPPSVNAGGNQTVTATHSGNPTTDTASLTLNGSATDPENDLISYTWTDSTNAVVGTNASLNLTLAPGNYTYTLTAADPFGGSSSQSIQVTVNPAPNQVPVANSQSLNINSFPAQAITLTGTDPDGDTLSYAVQSGPTHGSLSGTAPNLTYTPSAGYTGMDSFTFTVTDPYKAVSSTATVSLNVIAVPKVSVKLTAIGQLLGVVGIVVTINNGGSTSVTNVKLTSASLIDVKALLALPNNGFTLGAGKSAEEVLVFFPLRKGQKGTLNITGSYSGGTFNLSQSVTIP